MKTSCKIRHWGVAIAASLIGAIALGCGSGPVNTPQAVSPGVASTKPEQGTEVIRCIFPFWFGFAPVHVASELGYFAEEGLEVITVFDNDRANVMPAMDRGDIECTMRTIGEYMTRPRTVNTQGTIIGTIDVSVGADGVVAAPGINSVEDLVGKVFAGEINHPGTVMTQYALSQLGYNINEDLDVRLISTDDSSAVFEDPEVAAVATWEPMMSSIVENTSKQGAKILLSSKDFNGLITDVIIVHTGDLQADPEKYRKFLRGIYRAIDLYESDPEQFLAVAAPYFDVTPEAMAVDLEGVQYTSYDAALAFMGTPATPGKLSQVFRDLNKINLQLDLQDEALEYSNHVDVTLIQGLFDHQSR
ncbi:MAG: ABC transporter substrate-binding protein [Synechococcales bacterium]|nr:ABC transporter substrate-binding protein [Synechococcales bacterium]